MYIADIYSADWVAEMQQFSINSNLTLEDFDQSKKKRPDNVNMHMIKTLVQG